MSVRRPGGVTAAAVMAIVYGSLLSICGVCGVAGAGLDQGAFGPQDPNQQKLQKEIEDIMAKEVPAQKAFQIGGNIVGLLEAIAMLIAGIGLLGMRSWARTLAIVAAAVIIVTTLIQTVYYVIYVGPATRNAMQLVIQNQKGPQPAQVAQVMEITMSIVVVAIPIFMLLIVAYVVVILVLLTRAHVRQAFANPQPADDGDDDRYREEDRYREDDGFGRDEPRESGPPDDRFR